MAVTESRDASLSMRPVARCTGSRGRRLAAWVAAPVAFAVVSCAGTPASAPPAAPAPTGPASAAPEAQTIPADARLYAIDPERTRLTILVHRAGALGKLGHNHVVISADETGRAWIGADGKTSGLEVHLPVSRFVVDDPQARAASGPDFATVVPDDARAGTFGNMTGERVLDAAHYPEVIVRYHGVPPGRDTAPVRLVVTIKGQEHAVDVPMVVQTNEREITAAGETNLAQSGLGIEPFSIMGGAIAVADEIVVRFELVATQATAR